MLLGLTLFNHQEKVQQETAVKQDKKIVNNRSWSTEFIKDSKAFIQATKVQIAALGGGGLLAIAGATVALFNVPVLGWALLGAGLGIGALYLTLYLIARLNQDKQTA